MELSLESIIKDKTLLPTAHGARQPSMVHGIAVYDKSAEFMRSLKDGTLVFFPRGASAGADVAALAAAGSVAARYADEPGFDGCLPELLIPDGTSVSEALAGCYALAYSSLQTLAQVSLATMELLSDNLLNHDLDDSNMLKIIHHLLECPVAFTTPDFHLQKVKTIPKEYLVFNPLYTEDSFDWDIALMDFQPAKAVYQPDFARGLGGAGIGAYVYTNAYCAEQGCRICIFPVTDAANCYGYIFLALDAHTETLSLQLSMKLQQILVALKFEIIKSEQIAHTINRYYDFLLDELIESEQTDFRKLMQKYGLVRKVVADEYYVLVAGRKSRGANGALLRELLTSQQFNLLYDRLVSALSTINFFIFERKDSIVTMLPRQLFNDITTEVQPLIDIFREFLAEQYEGAGVSEPSPTESIRAGYFQALKALSISRGSPGQTPCFYSELGILRFFFDNANKLDPTPLLSVYRKYILPILDYDKTRGGTLFPTLSAYISCCSSPSAVCAALFIHKNTLYSRLGKIVDILGVSLSDSEALFNISLGIRVHMLIETGILRHEPTAGEDSAPIE